MRFSQWPVLPSIILAVGGLSWLIKIGIIVATDGRIITSGPASVLMSAGIVLLLLGAAGLGAGLARNTHLVARIGAALAATGILIGVCIGLGIGGSSILRGHGPTYLEQEAGLFGAGFLWFTVGVFALRNTWRARAAGGAPA